jgi:hypothetical protein
LAAASTAQAKEFESAKLKRSITKMVRNTQQRQMIMGYKLTSTKYIYKTRKKLALIRRDFRWWAVKARTTWVQFVHPPHESGWECIHHFEGSWSDSGDPYWGGLQMDRGFMRTYALDWLLRKGWANRWTPLEQMWVAERAHRSGRGYGPWPNTARYCGLL